MTFRKAQLMLTLEKNSLGLTESELGSMTETQLEATLKACNLQGDQEFEELCREPSPMDHLLRRPA